MNKGAGHTVHPTKRRLLASAAVAGGCAALGWQLGAVAVGIAVMSAAVVALQFTRSKGSYEGESDRELRAHLARARRCAESVDLVVVRAADGSRVAARLKASLRVTDSACLSDEGGVLELIAMVDREQLDQRALEARLHQVADGPLKIGWARFPEDGYTLSSLIGDARQRCQRAAEPGGQLVQRPVTTLAQGVVGQ